MNQQMNDEIIEWKDPDGKITKLNFDDEGRLITKSNEKIAQVNQYEGTVPNNKHFRYYEDLNLNQYRWTTHRQSDGKFHAFYMRAIQNKYNLSYKQLKTISFKKKRLAIAWCLKRYLKAKERQHNVINARAIRKKARLDSIPKQTKSQFAIEKRKHYEKLQKDLNKKIDKQIKTLKTRCRTYQKKINYYKKREVDLK